MAVCPSYSVVDPEFRDISSWMMNTAAISTVILNGYCFYCILFLSTKRMKTYRWYLFIHQVACLAVDLFINSLTRPQSLLPLPVMYLTGQFQNILPCQHFMPIGNLLGGLNFFTILQLFIYRLSVIITASHISVKIYKILLAVGFVFVILASISIEYTYIGSPGTTEEYIKNYSCIAEVHRLFPNMCAYDFDHAKIFLLTPFSINFLFITIMYFCLIWSNYRAVKVANSSPKLKILQRRFILQIILQAFLPYAVIFIPLLVNFLFMTQKEQREELLGNLIIISCSLFSSIDALVLIVMNKSYHSWIFTCCRRVVYFRKKGTATTVTGNPRQSGHPSSTVLL